MPKIVNYEEKKQMIMKKSMESFLKKGVHGTHLVDIANACKMGRTTIYQYFRNKDQILEYTIQNLFQDLRVDIRETVLDDKDNPYEKIRKLIPAIVKLYLKNQKMIVLVDLWLILIRENNPMVRQLNEHMEETRNIFQGMLEEGIKEGVIRPMNAESMAFTLYATIESFLLHMAIHQEQEVSEHIESLDMLLEGLKA
ncbi:DNA-binding transcriptional regulator, AcrR family [Tindallia magadiensis]|uniref:DNA-binding transcriptional regulator, AcrR family n=1 Tax=Tindallia magadiensis TaxID=69895 RepID=A0A1I3DVC3_9FIRM|nr:TetR/AcrR family transcriptional regulator [Tindallia magadiensis]SFH90431.1 DNA-binding transcriptional regulator, AcrR family [Tindallia magadiensis]